MEDGGPVSDAVSPESTVTSLLSSSGRLRSSLLPPEPDTSFRYRNKDYESASAALDAYIADFDRSCQNCRSMTGRLVLPNSPPSMTSRPRLSTLRNKDVLRESLTERELDYLNLPVSSLRHRVNRDRLSMTTDELLSIPYDGSMPVTHTSAFIQGLQSQSGASWPRCFPSNPGQRTSVGLSSSQTRPRQDHPHHLHPVRSSRWREGAGAAALKTPDNKFSLSNLKSKHRTLASDWAEPSTSQPHWFTSRTSSIPGVKYPAWIQDCDRTDQSPPIESKLWEDYGVPQPAAARTTAPSWVAELEDDDPDQACSQVDNQSTLRDLQLQFAEQISLLAAGRQSSDIMDHPFRDIRIESLIQKADQVLNSLSQSCEGAGDPAAAVNVSPVKTEELLLPSFIQHSEAAAGGGVEAQNNKGTETPSHHGNNIWKQPGLVEALKQMLFRLQAVEAKLQQREQASAAPHDGLLNQRPGAGGEQESFSCGPSLHRALHHLSRLKRLVEEPREKHREEEEEKDEDEGRYSSSSMDRLTCAQQKPS